MDTMTTQLQQAFLRRSQSTGATSTATATSSNPFDAIIAAMVQQMMENGDADSKGDSLLGTLMGDDTESDTLMASNSGLFNMQGMDIFSLLMGNNQTGDTESAQSLITAFANQQGTPATAALLQYMQQSTSLQNLTGATENSSTLNGLYAILQQAANGTTASAENDPSAEADRLLATVPVVSAGYTENEQSTGEKSSDWSFQRNYLQNIQSVREQLKASDKDAEKTVEPLSIDQLQGSVRTTNLESLIAQKTESATATTLANQIGESIKEHIALGDSEFTMKLQPEALGEITIKLVKAGEKVTLDIIAANSHTARLINSDLTALQDAVKPMQVEVHEALTAQTAQNQQYNMSGQQFAGQQHSSHSNTAHYGAASGEETYEETAEDTAEALRAQNGAMNLYI